MGRREAKGGAIPAGRQQQPAPAGVVVCLGANGAAQGESGQQVGAELNPPRHLRARHWSGECGAQRHAWRASCCAVLCAHWSISW